MRAERAFVKGRLEEFNLTQAWLRGELERVGIIVEKGEFSNMLSGNRRGPKAETAIQKSVEILREYEKKFLCQ